MRPQSLGWQAARRFLFGIFVLGLFGLLFVWRLGDLTTGLSITEVKARSASSSINAVINNPIYAPHKLLQLALQSSGHHGAFWMRGVSVFFAVIFLLCLYLLLKAWFGRLIAFFSLLIFASTPLFILSARSATPTIMLLSLIAIIAAFVWLVRSESWPRTAWIVLCGVAALACYTPGVLWLIVAGILFGRKRLVGRLQDLDQAALASGVVLFITLLVPVMLASMRDLGVAKELLLIPSSPPSPWAFIQQAGWAMGGLFWKSRVHFDTNTARLATLSAAQIILSLLGIYTLLRRAPRDAYFLLAVVVITAIAIGLGQSQVFLLFCLPVFGLAVGAGLRYLYYEWRSVFPRNPLPKAMAILLMGILVALQLVYGVRMALVAWPHTAETKRIYVLK
jgi:hypothetical protein